MPGGSGPRHVSRHVPRARSRLRLPRPRLQHYALPPHQGPSLGPCAWPVSARPAPGTCVPPPRTAGSPRLWLQEPESSSSRSAPSFFLALNPHGHLGLLCSPQRGRDQPFMHLRQSGQGVTAESQPEAECGPGPGRTGVCPPALSGVAAWPACRGGGRSHSGASGDMPVPVRSKAGVDTAGRRQPHAPPRLRPAGPRSQDEDCPPGPGLRLTRASFLLQAPLAHVWLCEAGRGCRGQRGNKLGILPPLARAGHATAFP